MRNSTEKNEEKIMRRERISAEKEEKEKIINFLADSPENGAFFSISMSVYSLKSFEDKRSNLIRESNLKILSENILEEPNEASENSPIILKDLYITKEPEMKKYFDFSKI